MAASTDVATYHNQQNQPQNDSSYSVTENS